MTNTRVDTGFGRVFPSGEALAQMPKKERQLAQLLALESGTAAPAPASSPAPAVKASNVHHLPLRAGDVDLGLADTGGPVGLDLAAAMDGRLLVQGVSGAGKSWTLRRLLEQTRGRIQHIVIDPDEEFSELAVEFDYLRLDAGRLDAHALASLALRLREHRVSAVLDLSQLPRPDQMIRVTALLKGLIAAPREVWTPAMVVIDEAQLFAPYGASTSAPSAVRKASIDAVVDLMGRGRKRGLAGVLATRRMAQIAKSATSDALNVLIGQNTLDLDIRRAAETIGWDASKAFDRLPLLAPGEFVASGPAFSRSPAIVKIGGVETRHRGARPEMSAPSTVDAGDAAGMVGLAALMAASDEDEAIRDENRLPVGSRAVRGLLRDPAFKAASLCWLTLLEIAPEGAALQELLSSFSTETDKGIEGLALLDQYGVVEFRGEGKGRAVRAAPDMVAS